MCGCKKETEWFFTYKGTEYAYNTHAKATVGRRKIAADNPQDPGARHLPLGQRQVEKAKV